MRCVPLLLFLFLRQSRQPVLSPPIPYHSLPVCPASSCCHLVYSSIYIRPVLRMRNVDGLTKRVCQYSRNNAIRLYIYIYRRRERERRGRRRRRKRWRRQEYGSSAATLLSISFLLVGRKSRYRSCVVYYIC